MSNFTSLHQSTGRKAGLLAAALAAAAFARPTSAQSDETGNLRHGKVFVSTNATTGNEVLVYARATGAAPTLLQRIATRGAGTGAALGSQGAVTLSRNGQHLFVVNAASNTLSTFSLSNGTMTLASVVDTGSQNPTSVTERDGLVYVLNAGGNGSVSGFTNANGVLTPLADGLRGLSQAGGTAPAQVSFNTYGDVLVITERATSRLTSYSVLPNGTLARQAVTASPGATPFGFAFTANDTLLVTEAPGSSVSSYRFVDSSRLDAPRVVTAALPDGQGAACWLAVTPNGRHAYAANAATSSISSYAVGRDGRIALQASLAASTGSNAGALDLSVTPDGQQLHVLAPRSHMVVSYAVTSTGGLSALGSVGTAIPDGAAGLAAN